MSERARHTQAGRLGYFRATQSPLRGRSSPPLAHRRRAAKSHPRAALRRDGVVLEGDRAGASVTRSKESAACRVRTARTVTRPRAQVPARRTCYSGSCAKTFGGLDEIVSANAASYLSQTVRRLDAATGVRRSACCRSLGRFVYVACVSAAETFVAGR